MFFHYPLNIASNELADVAYRADDNTATGEKYHYHEGFEIMQIWSDNGFVLVEDKVYPMQSGHIYIFNAQDMHRTTPAADTAYIRSKLTFSPLYIRSILEPIDQLILLDPFLSNGKKTPNCIAPDEETVLHFDRLFHQVAYECSNRQIGFPAMARAYLLEMLTLVYRCLKQGSKLPAHPESLVHSHIKSAIAYVNNNLTTDISHTELCNHLHLSQYYLCHLFKSATGMTLSQYIVNRRVSEAKKLLHTEKPISDIAMETGFSSFSLFSRTFSRVTGMAPREYRSIR